MYYYAYDDYSFIYLLFIIVVPCIIAAAICGKMKADMNTARKQTQAAAYMVENGVVLTAREDVYTHSTQQVIQTGSSGPAGNIGGGMTIGGFPGGPMGMGGFGGVHVYGTGLGRSSSFPRSPMSMGRPTGRPGNFGGPGMGGPGGFRGRR